MATLLALVAVAPSGTSTRPVVPRMPSVAVGVDIFMSPVLATAAATKATVPLAISNSAAFCLPPSSYTKLSTVIFALAVRLNVVASLKVTPSVEFADVCNTSFRKMSSCSLSGIELLLRTTVALPVSVATFPIGSSAAARVGEGAVVGAGAGCVCASLVAPNIAPTEIGIGPTSMEDRIAEAGAAQSSIRQPSNESANENRRLVTMRPDPRNESGGGNL